MPKLNVFKILESKIHCIDYHGKKTFSNPNNKLPWLPESGKILFAFWVITG